MLKKLISVFVTVLIFASLLSACGSKPEYDSSQYVTLEYKYFNGEGVAVPVVTAPDASDKQLAQVAALLEETTFRYSPDNKLSNGDVVTVTPTYDEGKAEKKGFKPIVKEVKFTVKGLPEGTPVDLWEWEEHVVSKGKNGEGQLLWLFNYPEKTDKELTRFLADYVTLSVDKQQNLSNGDIVTVTATHNVEQARIHGYKIISEPTKQFTVSGLK